MLVGSPVRDAGDRSRIAVMIKTGAMSAAKARSAIFGAHRPYL